MSDQHFDDFIKQKLQNHSSAVPEGVWERIQAKREAADRRRGFWWQRYKGLMISLTALLIISSVVLMNSDWNNGEGATAEVLNAEKQKQLPASGSKQEKPATSFLDDASNTDLASDRADKPEGSTAHSHLPNQYADADANRGNRNNGQLQTSTTTKNAHASNNLVSPNKTVGTLAQARTAQRNITRTGRIQQKEKQLQRLDGEDVIFEQETLKSITRADASALLAENSSSAETNLTSGVQIKNFALPITDCPSAFGNRRNDWFVELFASPDFAIKSVEANNSEFLRRKDSTEKLRSAFTAGIRLSKNIGENLLLKTGLQYSQINEKFDYRSENERKTITVVTIRTIVRSPGDTVRVTDTSTMEQVGYRVKTTYNRYRSIDIPLILGYEFGNDNFKTSINAGLIFNLQSWQNGDMLDTSYTPVAFSKSSATFKRNIGLGIYAGVQFLKPIGARTEIFAEPYFHYRISSMTGDGSPFNQRFHAAGLNLGIRYKINGSRQQ